MNDFLDIESVKDTLFLSGTYREKKNDDAEYFEYEILDEPNKTYGSVINNLIKDNSYVVIKTNYDCKFKIKGYIVTQDDAMYQVTLIKKLVQSINKEVLSILKHNPATEYALALVEVDNPMELK